jgi:hypothetical protein
MTLLINELRLMALFINELRQERLARLARRLALGTARLCRLQLVRAIREDRAREGDRARRPEHHVLQGA